MKLQVPFIQLPLAFDAQLLAREIGAIEEARWRPHPQNFPGNSMLPLMAADGDPANESFAGAMRPTPELERCPYLMQVLESFGATIGRTRLMRLAGQAEVTRHADQGYYWTERVRIHVPITTQPTVRFECGESAVNMAEGECWIFDTWRLHRVLNDASQSRVHLVADSVGGTRFWDLVARGRPHPGPHDPAWAPVRVDYQPGRAAAFDQETANVPAVMTPWELGTHLGFLLSETVPNPQTKLLQQEAGRLMRTWRALWAQYGDGEAGRAHFRHAFDQFAAAVKGPAQSVMLVNSMQWYPVLQMMIGRFAVAPTTAQARPDMAMQRAMGDNA